MSENIKKRNGSWGYAFAYRDDSGQRRWARRYDKSWKQKDAQKAFFEARARVEAGHSLGRTTRRFCGCNQYAGPVVLPSAVASLLLPSHTANDLVFHPGERRCPNCWRNDCATN